MENLNQSLHQQLRYNPGIHTLFDRANVPFRNFYYLKFKTYTCFQYDRNVVYLPLRYKQYEVYWIIHEVGHYVDSLVRGEKEMGEGYPDNSEKDLSKYFHHPTELIAIVREMQGMKALGWKHNDIIKVLANEYEAPKEYFEALYYQGNVN